MSVDTEVGLNNREIRAEQNAAAKTKRAQQIDALKIKIDRLTILAGQASIRRDRRAVLELGLLRDKAQAEVDHLLAQQR